MWSKPQVAIGRLQVKLLQTSVNTDQTALRIRLTSLLSSADLQPPTMPPSAILIVRRLTDPHPGHVTPWPGVPHVDRTWERAIQHALATTYRHAIRPVNGYIAPDTRAVLFADEGEMLACLAYDMSRGEAGQHWWWKVVLRNAPFHSGDDLQTLLCKKAIAIPAILSHLAAWGQAAAVVLTLSPEAAMSVTTTMGKAYGLADFRADIVRPQEPASNDIQSMGTTRSEMEAHTGEKHLSREAAAKQSVHAFPTTTLKAPWERWLLSTLNLESVGKERICLLGLGLALYHEPARVRTQSFLRVLRHWWRAQEASIGQEQDFAHVSLQQLEREELVVQWEKNFFTANGHEEASREAGMSWRKRESPARAREDFEQQPAPQRPDVVEGKVPFEGRKQEDVQGHVGDGQGGLASPSTSPGTFDNQYNAAHRASRAVQSIQEVQPAYAQEVTQPLAATNQGESDHSPQLGALAADDRIGSQHVSPLQFEAGVVTELGGLLYLINLMRYLELPACFEEDWGLASQVGTWGTLEVLGRALLRQDTEHLAGDPLWQALAALDGRAPGELPGQTLRGNESFRLPTRWVRQVSGGEGGAYSWATKQSRLRLWSAQGYMLVDCSRDASTPELQARNALRAYMDGVDSLRIASGAFDEAPVDNLSSPLLGGMNPHLTRWVAMGLPYIRFRLHQALRRSAAEPLDLDKTLLRYRGRLYVTSSHVDLVMRLEDISIPVRLAGLDGNPGWMPDFARVVLFHFA